MKMIDGLNPDSQKQLALVELSFNIVPPRKDDVADMLAQYRENMVADEAEMGDEEYRGILGID